MSGTGFQNPDLKQIWEALQDGNLDGYLQILCDAANEQNNKVSIVEFAYSTGAPPSTAFDKYTAWITANTDFIILNEISYPNPSTVDGIAGTPIIMVRYKGQKLTSDEPA